MSSSKLSRIERKMVESYVKEEIGYRYCKVCGKPVLFMNGQPWEQWEWERRNETHWACWQRKQAQKMWEAQER